MRILVTGGAGFIGSNFIRYFLGRHPTDHLVNLDKLTYAGNLGNLDGAVYPPRYNFHQADVNDRKAVSRAMAGCDAVVHFAAETHVDRSIEDPSDFLRTNVLGTHVLLEAARQHEVKRFLQISTDEVYGSLLTGGATEDFPLRPNSPYAASKAGADCLVRSYFVTFGLPILIVRASNNFGPYQFPEKFIPLMMTNALDSVPLPIYGDGRYMREWLFVEDFCEAVELLLAQGEAGQVYNVGSGEERLNLDVAHRILRILGKPETLLQHVADRLGHDRRYSLISRKIRTLGWEPRHSFEEALEETARWYEKHRDWWRPLQERLKGGKGCQV